MRKGLATKVVFGFALLSLATLAWGAGKKTHTPVTVTFQDGAADRIKSDGAPYTNGGGMECILMADAWPGNLKLSNYGTSSPRTISLDFSGPTNTPPCQPDNSCLKTFASIDED